MRRASFLLCFSASLGVVLALTVAAFARETGSATRQFAAIAGDSPSPAPLAVFGEPRSARDVLPTDIAARVSYLSGAPELAEEVRNGTLEFDRSKLLLADVGSTHSDLYAFPTSKGRVCYVLKGVTAGCHETFSRELPVTISMSDADGFDTGVPTTIMGLVPNNVVAVDVLIAGQPYAATLNRNAYFFEPSSTTLEPEGLRVTFRGGRVTTITLPALPAH